MLNGQFQVRPWKEFTASRGLARLQSVPLLASNLADEGSGRADVDSISNATNAYEFMCRRRATDNPHPALSQWIARVRVGNFTLDAATTPLCVGYFYQSHI